MRAYFLALYVFGFVIITILILMFIEIRTNDSNVLAQSCWTEIDKLKEDMKAHTTLHKEQNMSQENMISSMEQGIAVFNELYANDFNKWVREQKRPRKKTKKRRRK